MSTPLLGLSYLGFVRGRPGAFSWQSFNTTTWNHLPEFFHSATAEDVATAGNLAAAAAPVVRGSPKTSVRIVAPSIGG
jgi:hypothetical protein